MLARACPGSVRPMHSVRSRHLLVETVPCKPSLAVSHAGTAPRRCRHYNHGGQRRRGQHAPFPPAPMCSRRVVSHSSDDPCLESTRVQHLRVIVMSRPSSCPPDAIAPAGSYAVTGAPPAAAHGVDCRKCNILRGERFAIRWIDSPSWPSRIGRFEACGSSTPASQL